jgi:hypothetical protein
MRVARRLASPGGLALIFFPAAAALAVMTLYHSVAATQDFRQAYDQLTVTAPQDIVHILAGKVRDVVGSALTKLGLRGSRIASAQDVSVLLANGVDHRSQATRFAVILASVSLAFLGVLRIRAIDSAAMAGYICGISALWLIVGILAPMLTIVVRYHVPLLGETVIRYDTKNVVAVVSALWTSGNVAAGMLLLTCGIVIPTLKLLVLLLALLSGGTPLGSALARVGRHLAPWGMADMLALAILVAFLALGSDHNTHATLEVGAYFFAGHCLLAMIPAHQIAHWACHK